MTIALIAVTVGVSLSVAGAQMESILANPPVSPFMFGMSIAVSFGTALELVAVFPLAVQHVVPVNAFLMAMVAALFIHFASTMRGVTVETIVLLGIALVSPSMRCFHFWNILPPNRLCGALLLSVTSVVSKTFIPGAILADRRHHRSRRRTLLLHHADLQQPEAVMVPARVAGTAAVKRSPSSFSQEIWM